MMGTELVPETSVIFNQSTQLIARKDFTDCVTAGICLHKKKKD
jgi:hypothetical protein